MAEILRPVTNEIRATHLDLLAHGEKVIEEERSKHLPLIIACIAVLVIAAIVIYYEHNLSRAKKLD